MSAQIVGANETGVARSVPCIQSGGVLLYPTETVYGLGGDARDANVANRIRVLKGSEGTKPMLVLIDEWFRVAEWIERTTLLVDRLLAGMPDLPITFLLPASVDAPMHLTGEDGLIGIRQTTDSFCRELVVRANTPLLSTSANKAGGVPPVEFEDVDSEIRRGVDVAVDARRTLQGVPSTIVRLDGKTIHVIRKGEVDVQTIHEILGMA